MLDTIAKRDKENEQAKQNHDRIVEKSKQTGKSAAQIEQEELAEKKLKLTESQQTALAVGLVAAGAALTIYSAYKYRQIMSDARSSNAQNIDDLLSGTGHQGSTKASNKTGDSDFLAKAFSGQDYSAYTNFQSDKKKVNELLTDESGKWWKSLSKSEQQAIETYSGGSYSAMNNALWAAKGGDVDDYASPHIAKAIKEANSALSKARFPETMVCTQGLSLDKASKFLGISQQELVMAAEDPEYAKKFVGAVNTNHGLFSTSTGASGGFSGSVKYKVLTPKGAHAQYIEHISQFGDLNHPPSWDGKKVGGPPFSGEFETLFEAGSKFATRGIQWNTEGGYIEVALEYVFDESKK